jgi:hypothetical protein
MYVVKKGHARDIYFLLQIADTRFFGTSALTCVTRATAELPSFHGVSRKKLLAWPATQMQSGGGIVDLSTLITNTQSMTRTGALDDRPVCDVQA